MKTENDKNDVKEDSEEDELNDDQPIRPNENCCISQFYLGKLTRYETTREESGETRTYPITYSGSYFPMEIDQTACTITNTTPLLLNTDCTIIPVYIEGVGTFSYRPKDDDAKWHSFNNGDILDFTSDIVFRVEASDGTGFCEYNVSIVIRSNNPEGYTWEQMEPLSSDNSWLAGLQERRAITWHDGIVLAARHQNGQRYLAMYGTTSTPKWTVVAVAGADDADVRTLQDYSGKLWLSTTAGALLQSTDGKNWQTVTQMAANSVQLLAASSKALYAWIDGATVCASVDGQTWSTVELDDDISLFPTTEFTSVSYTQENKGSSVQRVAIVGIAGSTATVWNKIVDDDEPWCLLASTDDTYALPWLFLSEVSLVSYTNKLIAIGNKNTTYQSTDNGLTWWEYTQLSLPEGPSATAGEHICACATDEYIWFFTGVRLWRASVNSYVE